ncbi:MAG: EAL domain-containing protein [Trichodesmium sp. MAG_R03]|nr:EAL domain-containing protein [Trichodesmium sp. MAG_R03]
MEVNRYLQKRSSNPYHALSKSAFLEKSNDQDYEVIQTIVTLAHRLGLDVVTERIETEEQLAKLKDLGCEYGQGFLFSEPVNAIEATALLGSNFF